MSKLGDPMDVTHPSSPEIPRAKWNVLHTTTYITGGISKWHYPVTLRAYANLVNGLAGVQTAYMKKLTSNMNKLGTRIVPRMASGSMDRSASRHL